MARLTYDGDTLTYDGYALLDEHAYALSISLGDTAEETLAAVGVGLPVFTQGEIIYKVALARQSVRLERFAYTWSLERADSVSVTRGEASYTFERQGVGVERVTPNTDIEPTTPSYLLTKET